MKTVIYKLQACKGFVSLSNEECEKVLDVIVENERQKERIAQLETKLLMIKTI